MKYPLLKKYGISRESRVGDIEFALSKAEGIHTNTFYVKRQVWDGDFEVFGHIQIIHRIPPRPHSNSRHRSPRCCGSQRPHRTNRPQTRGGDF